MKMVSSLLVISGVVAIIYGIWSKERKSYYFKSVVINKNKEREYLDLQLYVMILNGFLLIIAGMISFQFVLPSFYYTGIPVMVHLNNFIAKMIGFRKGYLEDI